MSIFDRPAPVPTGPTNVNDVAAHDLLKVMFGELQQISKKLDAPNKKQEYITIGAAGYNFDALGYRNSVLVVANTGTLTVSLAGFSYTVSLQVGPNQVNFPDGCTIKATTPVEGVLIRDNFPIFRSENVAATIADGADVTLGAQNDAAVTDYTAAASAIALYKGILETLKGTINTQLTGSNPTDAQSNYLPGMEFNGATYDRAYNNMQGILLPSGARTATTITATQTNYDARGIQVTLNVTQASGTGGLSVILQGIDPVTGSGYNLNTTPTAVTATGETIYELYPGSNGTGITQRTSGTLPRKWRLYMYHLDATSYTYSVGYQLIK